MKGSTGAPMLSQSSAVPRQPTSRVRLGLRWLKRTLFRGLGGIVAPLFSRNLASEHPRRLLVIQLQQLGDSVIFTPTLRALRERFPGSSIDLLVNPLSHQFHRKNPHVDRFRLANSWRAVAGGTRILPLLQLIRDLRRSRYDTVIVDATHVAFKYTLIAWLTGASDRVGFNDGGRGMLHTVQIRFDSARPLVDLNLEIARHFGVSALDPREEIFFDEDDRDRSASVRSNSGVGPVVALHTGSNWQSKAWFPDRWVELSDALAERFGAHLVFVGGPDEVQQVQTIRNSMIASSHSLVGATDLPQLAAFLSTCDLFVGTDSGPRNVAGAVGTPTVVLMSSQDDSRQWIGRGTAEQIIRTLPPCRGCFASWCSHRTCMDLISVEQALEECAGILNRSSRRN